MIQAIPRSYVSNLTPCSEGLEATESKEMLMLANKFQNLGKGMELEDNYFHPLPHISPKSVPPEKLTPRFTIHMTRIQTLHQWLSSISFKGL